MKTKQTLKRAIDFIMILLLPILMAEILTGQEVHEWLGVGMALCFILHLALNAAWFKNLFRGSYSPARCLQTIVNLLLCADILALLISGIMMSGFVFSWLKVSGGTILARQLHLFASYWGLILMSAHLGLNWSVMLSAGKKLLHIEKDNATLTWALRILAIGVSAYGIYAVISQKLHQYLFLQTHFVLFDETKSAFVFFLETAAMIVLFAAVFYALQKCISKIKCGAKAKQVSKWATFAATLAVCVAVAISFGAGQPAVPSWGGTASNSPTQPNGETVDANDNFILIKGGSFQMGSPETEGWRSDDETQHTVTVSEWVWDYYGVYSTGNQTDPVGAESGSRRVYRGGGWNDFAKNMRSAYRGALVQDQAQHDQNIQARPEIKNKVENFDQYDTILIGYPNWWASIPMPIASFLEEYDFSGKTIIPFCSHGGGRFGQSLTAIAKLAPDATMGEGLSIHYSGGSTLGADVKAWLKRNNIQ